MILKLSYLKNSPLKKPTKISLNRLFISLLLKSDLSTEGRRLLFILKHKSSFHSRLAPEGNSKIAIPKLAPFTAYSTSKLAENIPITITRIIESTYVNIRVK